SSKVFTSQAGPGNLLDHIVPQQMKKTEFLVGNPQIPCGVFNDRTRNSAGNGAYRNKPVIFKVAEPTNRGDPNSPAIILKQRMRVKSVELPVSFVAAGYWLCAAPGLRAALAVNRNLPVIPSVQAVTGAEPDAAIPGCQNGPDDGRRQTLVHR